MKFKFKMESQGLSVEVVSEEECLPELLHHIRYFLQGCSFHVPRDLVIEDDYSKPEGEA